LVGRLGNHPERHVCMLYTAELRALAAILARAVRLKPFESGTAGDQVALALQTGNPEAVNDVVGVSPDGDWPAHWNVDFVSSLQNTAGIFAGIADLPPPLGASHVDVQAACGRDRRRHSLADRNAENRQSEKDQDSNSRSYAHGGPQLALCPGGWVMRSLKRLLLDSSMTP